MFLGVEKRETESERQREREVVKLRAAKIVSHSAATLLEPPAVASPGPVAGLHDI